MTSDKEIKELIELSEKGDAKAKCDLGWNYYNGNGVEQSFELAVNFYKEASELGDARAQYFLAECYAYGEGVERSLEEALVWCKLSAAQGVDYARFMLRELEGVIADRDAAELQNAEGQYRLGQYYYFGKYFDKDIDKFERFFTLAAEQGHVGAQEALEYLRQEKNKA